MTDIPQEIFGGSLQNAAGSRPQPSAAESARADVAFGRVMALLSSGKAAGRNEAKDQSSTPDAPQLQICPAFHSELAADLFAALRQKEPGDEASTVARKQEISADTTAPFPSAPLAPPAMQLPVNHPCALEEISSAQGVDQSANMASTSSYLPDRLSLAIREDKKLVTDNDDRDAGALATCSEMKLYSMESKSVEAFPLITSDSRGAGSEVPTPDVDFSGPPIKIHVSELETHLPIVVMNALPERPQELPRPETPVESRPLETPEQQKAPVKILKFELEPGTLGGISVRLRVSHSRVDIQIAAENPSTSALLIDTRDALGSAIGEKGLRLHSYEVVNMPAAPATPSNGAGQNQSSFSEQQRTHAQERGFGGHDRDQRQEQEPQRHQRRRDETSAILSSVDLVL